MRARNLFLILTVALLASCIDSGVDKKASLPGQVSTSFSQQIATTPIGMGFGREKKWVGKKSYHGTLTDLSTWVKNKTGWQDLDVDKTRKNAIWSSVGLVGVVVFLALIYCFLGPIFLWGTDEEHRTFITDLAEDFLNLKVRRKAERSKRNYKFFIGFAVFLLVATLLVQNVLAVKYLVTAGEIDFLRFGITPFWPFVWRFFGVMAVIAIVFLYNFLMSKYVSLLGFGEAAFGGGLIGLVLPVFSYLLMALASLLNYFHVNILPFSFKVLLLGCILLLVLAVVLPIVKKGVPKLTIPYGLVCGFSMGCLGIIIAFFLPTIALLAMIAVIGSFVIAFFLGGVGRGVGSGSVSLPSSSEETEKVFDYYSPDNLEDIFERDIDGHKIYKSRCDGKYYRETITGYDEVDEKEFD